MQLELDNLTAQHALERFQNKNDLVKLAQAFDEEWKRFACDPKTGTRHLISTMGMIYETPVSNITYTNTQLIQPSRTPAEDRHIDDRFLVNKPHICGELKQTEFGYEFETLMIKVSESAKIVLDKNNNETLVYIDGISLPESVIGSTVGKPVSAIIDVPGLDQSIKNIRNIEKNDSEGQKIFRLYRSDGLKSREVLAIHTEFPQKIRIDFEPVYHKPFFA